MKALSLAIAFAALVLQTSAQTIATFNFPRIGTLEIEHADRRAGVHQDGGAGPGAAHLVLGVDEQVDGQGGAAVEPDLGQQRGVIGSLLALCQEHKLLSARGRQRTDSTRSSAERRRG